MYIEEDLVNQIRNGELGGDEDLENEGKVNLARNKIFRPTDFSKGPYKNKTKVTGSRNYMSNKLEYPQTKRETRKWCSFCQKDTHDAEGCWRSSQKCYNCGKYGHTPHSCPTREVYEDTGNSSDEKEIKYKGKDPKRKFKKLKSKTSLKPKGNIQYKKQKKELTKGKEPRHVPTKKFFAKKLTKGKVLRAEREVLSESEVSSETKIETDGEDRESNTSFEQDSDPETINC